jgi:predicted DNA-binding protein YlxM (UPF0122 family)
MSHSLCVMGVYDEVKMTVPMIVRYVHKLSKKNVTPKDPSRRTDKGKSSHVSSVENPVTLQEIADRSDITIKAPCATTKDQRVPLETTKALLMFDKRDKRKAPSGWSTIEA